MTVEFFHVGGSVRDELLGLTPHDLDFAVSGVNSPGELAAAIWAAGGRWGNLGKLNKGQAKHWTLKAHWGDLKECDFVGCRVEGPYSDGRHPDWVRGGELEDDIFRRDFTFNALARTLSGELVDLVGGQEDLQNRVVRVVGKGNPDDDAVNKLLADSIRTFRALRFAVRFDATLHPSIVKAFDHPDLAAKVASLNDDSKRKELNKLFSFDSFAAIQAVAKLPDALQKALFSSGKLWLKPTTEKVKGH